MKMHESTFEISSSSRVRSIGSLWYGNAMITRFDKTRRLTEYMKYGAVTRASMGFVSAAIMFCDLGGSIKPPMGALPGCNTVPP